MIHSTWNKVVYRDDSKFETVRLWMIQNSYDMIFITDVDMVCAEGKNLVFDMVTLLCISF